nr:hypothetical protein [Proteus terrae]
MGEKLFNLPFQDPVNDKWAGHVIAIFINDPIQFVTNRDRYMMGTLTIYNVC